MWIVLFLLFCVHLRPSADSLRNDVGLLYEREHRIIRELSKADQIDFERNIHLYRIPHEAVSAIIIGYAATDDLKNKIQQATQTWPNANDVKIKRITIGASGLEYA